MYLYGLPTNTHTDNISILIASIEFIKSTNRFLPLRFDPDDTRHFLFSCPLYAIKRAFMIGNVSWILQNNNLNYPTIFSVNGLNMSLYGLPTNTNIDNISILIATIEFIKSTNRFPP